MDSYFTKKSAWKSLSPHKSVLFSSTSGWLLDAFDFTILLFLLTTIGKAFHVSLVDMALVLTGTLFAKVIGNIVFGRWADKTGRKFPFMFGVLWFAAFAGLSGLAWNYESFFIFRVIFGIGFGGQWSAAAPLLMESVPSEGKGLASGIMMAGWEMGYSLSALAYLFLFPILGWRPMFALAIVPALIVAIFTNYRVKETFTEELRKAKKTVKIKYNKYVNGGALQGWAFLGAINFLGYAAWSLYPTFLETVRHFSPGYIFILIFAYSLASIFGKPINGYALKYTNDRILPAIYMILVIPSTFIYLIYSLFSVMILGAVLIGLFANSIFGIVPVYLGKRFPEEARAFGSGTGYAVAGVTGGIAPYLVALLTIPYGLELSMTFFIIAAAIVSLGIALIKPKSLAITEKDLKSEGGWVGVDKEFAK